MRAVSFVSLSLVVIAACSKPAEPAAPAAAPAAPAATAAAATPPPAPAPIAPRIEGPLGDTLDSYEKMRAAFAADDNATALSFAQPLADASKKAAEGATDVQKPALTALAEASARLAADKPADLKAARLVFADVSKHMVALLVADPKLREGRFLMECPMAPAYKRWVQTTPALRNPYWGSEMLECGSEIKDWAV